MTKLFMLVLGLLLVATLARPAGKKSLQPIVFVPGQLGSRIEAKLDKDNIVSFGCTRKTEGWINLWMDVWQLFPDRLPCFTDNIRLIYDSETGKHRNVPGVETRVPGFGDTDTVEYLDRSWLAWILGNSGQYAHPLVTRLVRLGYKRGVNIRGAPYDFRFAPHSQSEYFEKLKNLIEDTYKENGNKQVILLSHSMGGLFLRYFLNKQEQAWKDKFIHTFVSVNAPWLGTSLVLHYIASGYSYGTDMIDPLKIREGQRSFETSPYLLPRNEFSQNKYDPLVITPEKNYSIHNIDDFLSDVDHEIGSRLRARYQEEDYQIKHPGVPTHCVYSTGVSTPETYIYNKGDFPNKQPRESLKGTGDGTVNINSLNSCRSWLDQENGKDKVLEVDGARHLALLSHSAFVEHLHTII